MMIRAYKHLLLIGIVLLLLTTIPPKPVAASPTLQEGPTYIVQPGDSLLSIGLSFGVSAEEIQNANNLADPNALFIGQRLVIPGLEGITGLITTDILPFGASLTDLSRQYQLDPSGLKTLNRMTSPSETIAGKKFLLAIDEEQASFLPYDLPAADETLLEMAIRTGQSPWVYVDHNQLKATWDVIPGEVIYFPAKDEVSPSLAKPNEITINPLPLVQGETLQISVSTQADSEISGTFNNENLSFFTEDGENHYSFHGIHAQADPGIFPLQLTVTHPDGTGSTYEQLVLLSEGGYGKEWVYVSDGLDEDDIDSEDAYLQTILNNSTPERYWEGRFQYPVDEPCTSSVFGLRRDYNDGALSFYHTGLDFIVCSASNINVYAPEAGRVVIAEELTVKGNVVYIDHGWGVYSVFAHLSEMFVEVGDFVQPRDILGLIGDTGRSAGAHLHFEINIGSIPVNPQTWLDQEFP